MTDTLKDMGMWGLAILLMVLLLPIAIISFVITVKVTMWLLIAGVMLAFVGYVLVLPATVIASLTGNSENGRFIAIGVGVTLALLVAGMVYLSIQGREARHEFGLAQDAKVQSGELMRCTHPELNGTGEGDMTFSTEHFTIHETVNVNGWTCTTAGRTYAP